MFVSKDANGYGFEIKKMDDVKDVYISVFEGNSDTYGLTAKAFSSLAAIKYCRDLGLTTLTLVEAHDFSTQESYTNVYSTQYTISGRTYTDVSSTPVNINYPKYATAFKCLKDYKLLEGMSSGSNLARELVNPLTLDFKGGILVDETDSAKRHNLKKGDVIIALQRKRIETVDELTRSLSALNANVATLEILRAKKRVTIRANVKNDIVLVKKLAQLQEVKYCYDMHEEDRPEFCKVALKN